MASPQGTAVEVHMSKTVPQMKKIDRSDPERVEQISAPYEWQRAAPSKSAATPKSDRTAPDLHIRTVPVGRPARKRSR